MLLVFLAFRYIPIDSLSMNGFYSSIRDEKMDLYVYTALAEIGVDVVLTIMIPKLNVNYIIIIRKVKISVFCMN
jgi:hypothetical protein